MAMRALVYDGKPSLRCDWPEPRAEPGQAVVAVRLAGICRTDLEVAKGYMAFRGVMGHEFVGQVVCGPPRWQGKRVVGEINCVCGRCELCRGGLANHCPHRTVIGISGRDGVFADRVALPLGNLHEVPAAVPDERAVFAEPLAAAFQVLRQVTIDPAWEVIVLGDGRLGQLVARVLKGRCRRLILVGRHADKLLRAEKQGIQTARVEDFAPAGRSALVVEATGSPAGLELALRAVRPRGTIVLKSTYAGPAGPNLSALVVQEVQLVGSRCGPLPQALAALERGEVMVDDLVSRRFSLDRGLEALEAAAAPESLKVLIEVAPQA